MNWIATAILVAFAAWGAWHAIDATLNQLSADATHIKLIEGESLADLAPLVGMVGKARVESVRPLDRW